MTIAALRRHKRVESIDDERAEGNGIIITLKRGFTFDKLQDNRVIGADSVKYAHEVLRWSHPFAGPYDN